MSLAKASQSPRPLNHILGRSLRGNRQLGDDRSPTTYTLSSDGHRDFVSDTSIEADRYEIQADSGVAEEAKRLLASMPGRS